MDFFGHWMIERRNRHAQAARAESAEARAARAEAELERVRAKLKRAREKIDWLWKHVEELQEIGNRLCEKNRALRSRVHELEEKLRRTGSEVNV